MRQAQDRPERGKNARATRNQDAAARHDPARRPRRAVRAYSGRPLIRQRVRPPTGGRRAIDEVLVDGIETTLPLFRALVREKDIIDVNYHIHWLEQFLAKGGMET